MLYHPYGDRPVPVLLAPHPFGFTAIGNLFGEPSGPRTLNTVPGVVHAARGAGVAVLTVQSEGARYTGISAGYPPHVASYLLALNQAAQEVPLDLTRVVAAGLSMGGQEAVLLAALTPAFVRAVAVQNAVLDLIDWYRHLLRQMAPHAQVLRDEVGGGPRDLIDAWAERSPLEHVSRLAQLGVPIQLRLNDVDSIVPARTQGRVFAAALAGEGGRVEIIEDLPNLDPRDPGRSAHEHVDWDAMIEWLLTQIE